MQLVRHLVVVLALAGVSTIFLGCPSHPLPDGGITDSGSSADAGPRDAPAADAGTQLDAQPGMDADVGVDVQPGMDAGPGMDADVGMDVQAGMDASSNDAGPFGRSGHEATLLDDGRVLLTGGLASFAGGSLRLSSAAIYDPTNAQWATVAMNEVRSLHTATKLADGRVLLAGGWIGGFDAVDTAEIFDPNTNTFTVTSTMNRERRAHAGVLCPNGEVLLVGGSNSVDGALPAGETYDPTSGTFTFTSNNMGVDANSRSLLVLQSGLVLVAGGHRGAEVRPVDLYDCTTRMFTATGPMNIGRLRGPVVRFQDGRAMMVAGTTVNVLNDSVEIYDPGTGLWTFTASVSEPSAARTATVLGNNTVLVAGGYGEAGALLGAEIFAVASETFSPSTSNMTPRSGHTATLLQDGRVLIAGGVTAAGFTDLAEIYDPTNDSLTTTTPLPLP